MTEPGAAASGPTRVLLVDDYEDGLEALQALLERRGFQVATAVSVQSALDAADAAPFDILVSDIDLPDGDGYELLGMLRPRGPFGAIAVTGRDQNANADRPRLAGFDAYLTKPVSVGQLTQAIAEVLCVSAGLARTGAVFAPPGIEGCDDDCGTNHQHPPRRR